MLNGGAHRFRDAIASTLGWWAEAGVDAAVSEQPFDWLAPPPPPAPTTPRAKVAVAPAAAWPAELAAFQALLATGDYLPGAPPPRRRIAPVGGPQAPLMVLTDMPDEADLRDSRLLAAEARLFDAMLAALGLARDAVYLASLSPARLTGGRLAAQGRPLAQLFRAHLALARPRALLVLGDETCRALLEDERASACAGLRAVNHDGGSVAAIATFHPRVLRRTPACKAEAWAAMRHLLGVLAR